MLGTQSSTRIANELGASCVGFRAAMPMHICAQTRTFANHLCTTRTIANYFVRDPHFRRLSTGIPYVFKGKV